jgi:hypothetical protein
MSEVVTLYETNFRDVVSALRKIADEIERGDFGHVGCASVVVLGDRMEVFGMGPDSEGPSVGMLLHAGFMRLSRSIEEHGH